jgi:hypothetical protein
MQLLDDVIKLFSDKEVQEGTDQKLSRELVRAAKAMSALLQAQYDRKIANICTQLINVQEELCKLDMVEPANKLQDVLNMVNASNLCTSFLTYLAQKNV